MYFLQSITVRIDDVEDDGELSSMGNKTLMMGLSWKAMVEKMCPPKSPLLGPEFLPFTGNWAL